MLEDRYLIRRLKRGDSSALCKIYNNYGDILLHIAAGLLKDVQAAEDVLHDVFLSFAENIQKFRLTGSLKAYLAKCVANRARDVYRSRKRWPVNLDRSQQMVSAQPSPEQVFALNEELAIISEAVDQLPYEQRQVLLLHLQGDMRFSEIGRITGISENTIRARYRYAIDKIRSYLNVEAQKNEICGAYRTVG